MRKVIVTGAITGIIHTPSMSPHLQITPVQIAASAIEAVGSSFERAWHRTRRQPTAEETARLTANLGRVPLSVTAQLETAFSARELLAMQPGDVVHLGHSSRQPVTLQVGTEAAFLGHHTQPSGRIAISVIGDAETAAEGAAE